MAIFKQFSYSETGTEITFMQGLIDLICDVMDATCEDAEGNPITAVEELIIDASKQSAFYFNLGNGTKFKLQRERTNNQGTKGYSASFSSDSYGASTLFDYDMTTWRCGIDQVCERKMFIAYLKSDNLKMIWFGGKGGSAIANSQCVFSKIIGDENTYTSGLINSVSPLAGTFYGNNMSLTYSPIFAYSAGASKVDYADHVAFVSGGVKQFDCEEMLSCSTVSQWSTILLGNGKTCLAIAANALVPLDPEEE